MDDDDLWTEMMRDVQPLKGRRRPPSPVKNQENSRSAPAIRETAISEKAFKKNVVAKGRDIDRRTEERLRKGKMEIEGTLDLHGMTQDKAQQALEGFIKHGYEAGRRCVLVITGKGTQKGKSRQENWYDPKPGILREQVPLWLDRKPLSEIVLKYHPARQRDGGNGALYVLIRRKRV